jgi:hypothetical protein
MKTSAPVCAAAALFVMAVALDVHDAPLQAQSPSPAFDVVSIKRNAGGPGM